MTGTSTSLRRLCLIGGVLIGLCLPAWLWAQRWTVRVVTEQAPAQPLDLGGLPPVSLQQIESEAPATPKPTVKIIRESSKPPILDLGGIAAPAPTITGDAIILAPPAQPGPVVISTGPLMSSPSVIQLPGDPNRAIAIELENVVTPKPTTGENPDANPVLVPPPATSPGSPGSNRITIEKEVAKPAIGMDNVDAAPPSPPQAPETKPALMPPPMLAPGAFSNHRITIEKEVATTVVELNGIEATKPTLPETKDAKPALVSPPVLVPGNSWNNRITVEKEIRKPAVEPPPGWRVISVKMNGPEPLPKPPALLNNIVVEAAPPVIVEKPALEVVEVIEARKPSVAVDPASRDARAERELISARENALPSRVAPNRDMPPPVWPTEKASPLPEPLKISLELEPVNATLPSPPPTPTAEPVSEAQMKAVGDWLNSVKAQGKIQTAGLSARPGETGNIKQVHGVHERGGCPSCGRHAGSSTMPWHYGDDGHGHGGGGCSTCGAGGGCVPGRKPCYPCHATHPVGQFLCCLYECLCCIDPCYEPKWIPLADAGFFLDAARPVTQQRIGWDNAQGVELPDRSEYYWARGDGMGRGPKPRAPFLGERQMRYNDFTLYTETATEKLSFFVEMPYRYVDPDFAPKGSGFGDMNTGTKTLLYDCEMLQVAFQFRTYIPIGNTGKGVGNGHVTLEPSVLFTLKLTQHTYLQAQIAEWIPIAGDPFYAGSLLRTNWSLNHLICKILPDVPLIGTMELNTWSFQDGAYTDPIVGAFQQSSGETYAQAGTGLRLFVCDRYDIGSAVSFAITEDHFASVHWRTMFRFRF